GILSVFYYLFIYEAPSCEDGSQNQNEQGVDCGGVCPVVCSFDTVDPVVVWTRSFEVQKGVYNVVALVENPNIEVEAFDVPYSFKMYDKDNILIAERRGKTDIPARGVVPVFERTITVNERIPARSPSFEFTKDFEWIKTNEVQPSLSIKSKILSEKDGMTRLEVVLENDTVRTVENIEVTGILTDKEGSAIAVSQTIIESISKNNSDLIVFTWPGLLSKETSKIEVITLVK
ncbi:hypothetical protein KKC45_02340, partial [Patescibacteria group bacterium]|nr:hypothetical protein [Patescibacteria group bacterium]